MAAPWSPPAAAAPCPPPTVGARQSCPPRPPADLPKLLLAAATGCTRPVRASCPRSACAGTCLCAVRARRPEAGAEPRLTGLAASPSWPLGCLYHGLALPSSARAPAPASCLELGDEATCLASTPRLPCPPYAGERDVRLGHVRREPCMHLHACGKGFSTNVL